MKEIPQAIYEQALERVAQREVAKLKQENQELRDEIREMDEMEVESNGGRSG